MNIDLHKDIYSGTASVLNQIKNDYVFTAQPLVLGEYEVLVELITKLAVAICAAWLSIKEVSEYFSKRNSFQAMVNNESTP